MRAHWSSHPLIHPERLPSCELRTIVSDCQALSIRHLQQRCDLYVWDRVWARLAGSEVRSPFFSPCSVEQTNNSLVLCRCLTHSLLPWIHSAAARAKRHVTSMIRTLLKLVLDQVLQATSTLWKDQFLSKRCPEPIFCVCVLHTCSHRLNPCPLWRVFFFFLRLGFGRQLDQDRLYLVEYMSHPQTAPRGKNSWICVTACGGG